MTDRQHLAGLRPEAVKAGLVHIIMEHSTEHNMKLDASEVDQIAFEVLGMPPIKAFATDIIDTISDVVRRDISGWRNRKPPLRGPAMPPSRRQELCRILRPWRTIEQIAVWTDQELVEQYRLLCKGDPHLEGDAQA